MERLDGRRSWRSASVCALFLASSCFLIASLAALVLNLTKQTPPLQSSVVAAAHLVLKLNGNTSIHRGMLDWFDRGVQGAFLESSFEYNSQKLKIKNAGLYCIYAQINVELRGHHPTKEADAVLSIHRKNEANPALLTLHLHLSDHVKESYTNSTSQIYQLSSNDVLYGTLEGSTEEDYHWALKEYGNFFGVFRINEHNDLINEVN
ncbi:uncharacterized protein PHA67_007292 [Liasis olivaceus]